MSFINGFSFCFHFEGHFIKCWFSMLTGLEKVFVDDILVSINRSYKYKTKNNFLINGESFSTTMNTISILKGPFVCTLLKNNIPILRQRLSYSLNIKHVIILFLIVSILAVPIALISYYLKLPNWVDNMYTILVCIFIIALHNKYMDIAIEEESCI